MSGDVQLRGDSGRSALPKLHSLGSLRSAQALHFLRSLLFTIGVMGVSRVSQLWMWLRRGRGRQAAFRGSDGLPQRHQIQSGRHHLDAIFVTPAASPCRAALLICHGIGETVEDWHGVQQRLAAEGVASLVFDYAGYGRSSGWVTAQQCERDACAAFAHLEGLTPGAPISVLGFSLGSGVACAVVGKLTARTLVLCAAYTSFRKAAGRLKIPSFFVAPVWENEAALRSCKVPVLIVHGARDWLFPLHMAHALRRAGGSAARLLVFPVTHDEPFVKPSKMYWRGVVEVLVATGATLQTSGSKGTATGLQVGRPNVERMHSAGR